MFYDKKAVAESAYFGRLYHVCAAIRNQADGNMRFDEPLHIEVCPEVAKTLRGIDALLHDYHSRVLNKEHLLTMAASWDLHVQSYFETFDVDRYSDYTFDFQFKECSETTIVSIQIKREQGNLSQLLEILHHTYKRYKLSMITTLDWWVSYNERPIRGIALVSAKGQEVYNMHEIHRHYRTTHMCGHLHNEGDKRV